MKSLLVLACSQKKRPDDGFLPAIDRYDGPAFRVVRKFQRDTGAEGLSVWVLSARFGLIVASEPIPDYDRRMTTQIATELGPGVQRTLRKVIARRAPDRVGVCMSKLYRRTLAGLDENWAGGADFEWLGGGLGPRLAALKRWLHQHRFAYASG